MRLYSSVSLCPLPRRAKVGAVMCTHFQQTCPNNMCIACACVLVDPSAFFVGQTILLLNWKTRRSHMCQTKKKVACQCVIHNMPDDAWWERQRIVSKTPIKKKKGANFMSRSIWLFQRGVRRSRSLRRLPNYSETVHFLLNYQRQLWFSSQVKEG